MINPVFFFLSRNHSRDNNHIINEDILKILFRDNSCCDQKIVESLWIFLDTAKLNTNEPSTKSYVVNQWACLTFFFCKFIYYNIFASCNLNRNIFVLHFLLSMTETGFWLLLVCMVASLPDR